MSALADLLSDPGSWADRDALAAAILAALDVDPDDARAIAGTLADAERARAECAEAEERRRQASEVNDDIVQGLTAAVYALELDDHPRVHGYLSYTLQAASELLTGLLTEAPHDHGDPRHDVRSLVRSSPSDLGSQRAG